MYFCTQSHIGLEWYGKFVAVVNGYAMMLMHLQGQRSYCTAVVDYESDRDDWHDWNNDNRNDIGDTNAA